MLAIKNGRGVLYFTINTFFSLHRLFWVDHNIGLGPKTDGTQQTISETEHNLNERDKTSKPHKTWIFAHKLDFFSLTI